MEIGIVGTSIWQQNLPLLESLTLPRESRPEELIRLKSKLGVDELIVLSTCNRVEFIYAAPASVTPSTVLHKLIDFFLCGKSDIGFFPSDFFRHTGREAITHLFRTVSSLESLVVGETQITGQFKEAYQEATEIGIIGPMLDSLAREALATARRVKRETTIGEGAVSMASLAATELISRLDGQEKPLIALVGSGKMTEKLAKHINNNGDFDLLFVNRTVDKAQAFADQFSGKAMSLEQFRSTPPAISAIVSATAAAEPVFTTEFQDRLQASKSPVICIDLAIPRDFAPNIVNDDRMTLIDIPALKSCQQGNLRQKFVEAGKAADIVRVSVDKHLSDRIELSIKPVFQATYQETMEIASKALDDLLDRQETDLKDDERQALHRLITRLVGHSSFQPAKMLSSHLVRTRNELAVHEFGARTEAV
ncbi:MAG: glutamyl-tRNA reductase [candidate division Zixibacteria bacterium]